MDFDINKEYQDILTFVFPESPVSHWQSCQEGIYCIITLEMAILLQDSTSIVQMYENLKQLLE